MGFSTRMNEFAAKCGLPPPETATGASVIGIDGITFSSLDGAWREKPGLF